MLLTLSKNHWINFARGLVETGELDPPYVLMARAGEQYGDEWVERFALHYFLFYDLGGAAHCANSHVDFWEYARSVYPTAVRGTSRRHFRGTNGLAAIDRLSGFGRTAGDVFSAMYRDNYLDLVHHLEDNFRGCEIGPYFSWKLMDIFDRCLGRPVVLTMPTMLKYLPETPRKGVKGFFPNQNLLTAIMSVVRSISDLPAPGVPGRPCDFAEAETVLCAIYGQQKGTYHFGKDLDHRHQELAGFPELIKMLPPIQDWRQYATGSLES